MKRPNVVLIMTDDQGYGDLSCMGSPDFVTPNIDRLAASGTRFTSWYAGSPVCSPSRASLLTGRYPGNAGVRAILAGHRKAAGLTPAAPTLAAALHELGYGTGLVGKWHLGTSGDSRPNRNGFDYFYGFMAGCIDYYSHIFYWGMADGKTNPVHDLWENEKEVEADGRYFTGLVTEKSTDFIRRHAGAERPFFLYVAYNAPHYPMHAPRGYLERFPRLTGAKRIMAAMIAAVDDGVGEIRAELARNNILEDTFILYQSDNGPSREARNWLDGTETPYYGGSAGPFKGHKFSLFEGGIRVPGIISFPRRFPSGRTTDEPCAAMDVFPTILALAGGDPSRYELDGADISSVLVDGAHSPHETLFWEMDNQTAVRRGRHKLVLNGCLVEGEPAQDPVFLSDLVVDPGETRNLASERPDLAGELTEEATTWRSGIERRWETEWARGSGRTT